MFLITLVLLRMLVSVWISAALSITATNTLEGRSCCRKDHFIANAKRILDISSGYRPSCPCGIIAQVTSTCSSSKQLEVIPFSWRATGFKIWWQYLAWETIFLSLISDIFAVEKRIQPPSYHVAKIAKGCFCSFFRISVFFWTVCAKLEERRAVVHHSLVFGATFVNHFKENLDFKIRTGRLLWMSERISGSSNLLHIYSQDPPERQQGGLSVT